MAFNAGAFAGALGQSGLSTYERLNEAGFRNLQKQQLAQEIQEKADLDQAWRESQARVGQQDEYGQAIRTEGFAGKQQAQMLSNQGALPGNSPEDQAFERASAESAAGALRENAVRQGAIPEAKAALPEMKPTEYTKAQAMEDYVKAASQVSRKGTLEALQMKSALREDDLVTEFDKSRKKFNETLALIDGTAEGHGMEGVSKKANEHGIKNEFVPGKNGVGSRINLIGPKGDVLKTFTDVRSATKALKEAAFKEFYDKSASLLGSPDKVAAFMQGERKIDIEQQKADTDERFKERYIGVLGAKANAATSSFMNKLPEKDKFQLNSLNAAVQVNEKAYAANPTPEGKLSLGMAQLKLNKVMQKHGMVDDIYEGTGIPSPQEAAGQMIANKITNKADIDRRLTAARQTFGRDYADEVALALKENARVKPNKPNAAINTGTNQVANPSVIDLQSALKLNLPRSQRTTAAERSAVPLTHDGLPARQNVDGSRSTEVSITVTDPRINNGKPTNIPSLWGGREVDENTAVKNALSSGNRYQSFSTIEDAVTAAKARSNAGGASAR